MMNMFTQDILQQAFKKVCQRRIKYSPNNDIWGLRINWQNRKNTILNKLNRNIYRFDAAREAVINNEHYEIWSSEDAVVIEALTILLKERYNITGICTSFHLKGKGGVKAATGKY